MRAHAEVSVQARAVAENVQFSESVHPVLKRIYAARGVTCDTELDYSLAQLLPFDTLSGIDAASALLQDAIREQKRILIVADFDADGATACALAIRGLGMMGAEETSYIVPNRFQHGYGLKPEIVDLAMEYQPDILITVDNGINSVAGVAHAKSCGLSVVITDHHLPGSELPDADVIVNPQLEDDKFPSKNLSGVGVMFYILLALRARLKADDWFSEQQLVYPNLAHLLDIVALGTIADVVPLDKNNRILVAYGLKRIRKGLCVSGISALLREIKKTPSCLSAEDIAFQIAPRLNAAGRMADMSLGIECLLTDDEHFALQSAKKLNELNNQRRQVQDEMQAQAMLDLKSISKATINQDIYGLCVYHETWHQGVIGILAAQLKELFHRPAIVFASDGVELLKGSARSIAGIHICNLLITIAHRHPNLLLNFGGHAMAAGLSIQKQSFEQFKAIFNHLLSKELSGDMLCRQYTTDGALGAADLSLELAHAIDAAGPWGKGFPEPSFQGVFEVINRYVVSGRHLKLRLKLDNKIFDAIAFRCNDADWSEDVRYVQVVYKLRINYYQGTESLQLLIDYIEPMDQLNTSS